MKILIDSAAIESIKHLIEYYQIEGVTTNQFQINFTSIFYSSSLILL